MAKRKAKGKKEKKEKGKPASVGAVMTGARKQYGAGMFSMTDWPPIPTRFLRLDHALGGGLPGGKLLEVYGPPGSYKSTIVYCWMADVQAHTGKYAVLLDNERAWSVTSPAYLKRLGVDLDESRFIVIRPDEFEQSADLVNELVDTGQVGIVGLDSVAALATKAEAAKDVAGDNVAAKARKMSQWLDKALPKFANTGAVGVCVNQVRTKIGVTFGNPETTPGGSKLKFLASARLRMSAKRPASETARKANEQVVRISTAKNKITGERASVMYRATQAGGFLLDDEPLDWAVEAGVVKVVDGGYDFPGKETRELIKALRRPAAIVTAQDKLAELQELARGEGT